MKNETKISKKQDQAEDILELPSSDMPASEPVILDDKELARQRSKEDLARKRRDMHQKRGKR